MALFTVIIGSAYGDHTEIVYLAEGNDAVSTAKYVLRIAEAHSGTGLSVKYVLAGKVDFHETPVGDMTFDGPKVISLVNEAAVKTGDVILFEDARPLADIAGYNAAKAALAAGIPIRQAPYKDRDLIAQWDIGVDRARTERDEARQNEGAQ